MAQAYSSNNAEFMYLDPPKGYTGIWSVWFRDGTLHSRSLYDNGEVRISDMYDSEGALITRLPHGKAGNGAICGYRYDFSSQGKLSKISRILPGAEAKTIYDPIKRIDVRKAHPHTLEEFKPL